MCCCAAFYRKEKIRGQILLAPALGVNENFEAFLRKLVKILDKIVPWLSLKKFERGLTDKNPVAE